MSTSELPDIPGFNADTEARMTPERNQGSKKRTGVSVIALIATGFITVVLASAISLTLTVLGKEPILVMLGVVPKEKQPDAITIAIQEQKSQLMLLSQALDDAKQQLTDLRAHTDTGTLGLSTLVQRVSKIESFTADLEKRIAEHRKTQQIAVQQQQKAIAAKPKPAPIIPMTIVSIRNQAGTAFVSLRDGLDTSELLMPGDSWRGWTLLDADASTKVARFKVSGKVQELRL